MRTVVARHLVPALAAGAFLLPLVFMVSGSLRPTGLPPPAGVELLPPDPTLANYLRLPELLPLATYVRNSVLVSAVAVPLTVLVAALAGFGIRILPPRGRGTAIGLTLALLLVPITVVWATRFEVFRLLGVTDSLLPLMAPVLYATNPFFVLIYAWSYGGVRDSQLQSARLEGASWLTTWRRIALPQVRPATLAVGVLAFTFHWANFIDALLYLRGQERFTLPIGLQFLQLLNPTDFPLLMAGAVVFTLPAVAVFLLAQRVLLSDDPLAALRRQTA